MQGLFVFYRAQEVVFYHCDEELWNTITLSSPEYAAETSFGHQVHGIHSLEARSTVLQFFSPVFASAMFLRSQMDHGLSEFGASNFRLFIFTVLENTFILISDRTLALDVRSLQRAIESIFRMLHGTSLESWEEEEKKRNGHGMRLLHAVISLLFDLSVRPAFLLNADELIALPQDLRDRCFTLLKRACHSISVKFPVLSAFFLCGSRVIASFNREKVNRIDRVDYQYLPLIGSCSHELIERTLDQPALTGDQGIEDSLRSTHSSDLESHFSSFSTLLETTAGNVADIPSLSPTPGIALLSLFLRHSDGGNRPHRVCIISLTENFKMMFVGPERSQSLVSFCYDALQLFTRLHVDNTLHAAPDNEQLDALKEMMDHIRKSSEIQKISANLRDGLQRSHHFLGQLRKYPPLPRMELRSSLSKLCRENMEFSIKVLEQIIKKYLDADDYDSVKWRSLMSDLTKVQHLGRANLLPGNTCQLVEQRINSESEVENFSKTCRDLEHFVILDTATATYISTPFSSLLLSLKVMSQMKLMKNLGSEKVTMESGEVLATYEMLNGSSHESSKPVYELYTWHKPSTSDIQIASNHKRILSFYESKKSSSPLSDHRKISFLNKIVKCSPS